MRRVGITTNFGKISAETEEEALGLGAFQIADEVRTSSANEFHQDLT